MSGKKLFLVLLSSLLIAIAAVGLVTDGLAATRCKYNVDLERMECGSASGTCCKEDPPPAAT